MPAELTEHQDSINPINRIPELIANIDREQVLKHMFPTDEIRAHVVGALGEESVFDTILSGTLKAAFRDTHLTATEDNERHAQAQRNGLRGHSHDPELTEEIIGALHIVLLGNNTNDEATDTHVLPSEIIMYSAVSRNLSPISHTEERIILMAARLEEQAEKAGDATEKAKVGVAIISEFAKLMQILREQVEEDPTKKDRINELLAHANHRYGMNLSV